MRKIKFRGYQAQLKKWVYGNLIQLPNGGCFIFDYKDNFEDRVYVVPESVGQYTELKDRFGKEIYEGDIVRFSESTLKREIMYIDDIAGYSCWFGSAPSLSQRLTCDAILDYDIEVIGNIYENPKLLKS